MGWRYSFVIANWVPKVQKTVELLSTTVHHLWKINKKRYFGQLSLGYPPLKKNMQEEQDILPAR